MPRNHYACVLLLLAALTAFAEPGADLPAVLARATAGAPLRAVAIGGSITQAGKGWIGPWLRERFPHSPTVMHNAGMSATGSQLGVFRLDRDVIAMQPDLVLVEFAVNDGGLADADAIRYLESIVVRLKSLPRPPAVVFVETAARRGSNRARHQRVAAHYGLLDIDLQVAVDGHLKATGKPWDDLMSDDVHPNEVGHAFYAAVIAAALAPFAERPPAPPAPLPPPLSERPLLLDGRLVPIAPQPGWREEASLPAWWNRFFNGVISADDPGTMLTLPIRGTTIGLLYPLANDYGQFYVNLDGGDPHLVDAGVRGGYTLSIVGQDLPAVEHLVRIAVARPFDGRPGPVKLGYVLVAGQTAATCDPAPQGDFPLAVHAERTFAPLPASAWEWCGPYGGAVPTTGPTADLTTAFPPETGQAVDWRRAVGDDPLVDLAKLTGRDDRGVCYARTTIARPVAGDALLALVVDYFAKLWVNGELVRTIDDGHGHPMKPILVPVTLAAGENTILLKAHSGSKGNCFGMYVETDGE